MPWKLAYPSKTSPMPWKLAYPSMPWKLAYPSTTSPWKLAYPSTTSPMPWKLAAIVLISICLALPSASNMKSFRQIMHRTYMGTMPDISRQYDYGVADK